MTHTDAGILSGRGARIDIDTAMNAEGKIDDVGKLMGKQEG
jgi:hypothetical protein